MRNYNRCLVLIPAVGTVLLIQVLFNWLAPSVEARNVFYLFITALTLFHCVMVCVSVIRNSWRRAMTYVVAGSVIMMAYLIGSAVALYNEVTIRTAVYLGISAMLIYLIIAIPLMLGMDGEEEPEELPDTSIEPHEWRRDPRLANFYQEEKQKDLPPRPRIKT